MHTAPVQVKTKQGNFVIQFQRDIVAEVSCRKLEMVNGIVTVKIPHQQRDLYWICRTHLPQAVRFVLKEYCLQYF